MGFTPGAQSCRVQQPAQQQKLNCWRALRTGQARPHRDGRCPRAHHTASLLPSLQSGHPSTIALWEQLYSIAGSDPCPEAGYAAWRGRGLGAAHQLAATAVSPEQILAPVPVVTSGLVRSRVVKNRRGYWRIRHFQPSDLLAVADLQAASFHAALPVDALDKLAYTMFKAEVLDALKKKVNVLCEDGFAMLVVENCAVGGPDCCSTEAEEASTCSDSDDSSSDCEWEAAVWYGDQQAAAWPASSSSSADGFVGSSEQCRPDSICGVVEIGVQDEQDVLHHLPDHSGTYAYITSMAVAPHLRRCGVGRALLQAAEQQAANWQQQLVALHVYESNAAAIKLYEKHGMTCQGKDPSWKGLLGGRVRQLMVKEVGGSSSSNKCCN